MVMRKNANTLTGMDPRLTIQQACTVHGIKFDFFPQTNNMSFMWFLVFANYFLWWFRYKSKGLMGNGNQTRI